MQKGKYTRLSYLHISFLFQKTDILTSGFQEFLLFSYKLAQHIYFWLKYCKANYKVQYLLIGLFVRGSAQFSIYI